MDDTGAVFTIGRSRFADNVASHFFIRKDPVVSVTCGDEHSAVVCQSGRLFVFGSNDWGQLGLGHKNHVSKPSCVKVLKPEKVTHVACGRAHTLICTADQKIFACGSDQESQLGRGSHAVGDSSSSPVMVHDCGLGGPKVMQIAAGSHHSLALISDGGVLAWGSNLEGQLGLPGTSGLVNKPTKVHIPEPVKQISAGYYHSAFLTEDGNIYVCGETESGKLGISVDFMTQVAPKQMQLSGPAAFVTCGGHHTLILGEDSNIYCTGSNASGQLGMGSEITELTTPKLLPRGALQDETIKKIACGESHIAIVTDSGNLFTCGDGRHGKLGLEENENNVHELTLAVKYEELIVTDVSCGGCHTILVGRRRESNNEHAENQQDQLIQKKNPLPPLKIPVARISNENPTTDKPEENNKTIENNTNTTSPVSTTPSNETIVNGTTDSINNIEKPESAMKLSDYQEEAKTNTLANSEETNGEHKEVTENNNEESTIDPSNNKTVDADNNMAEKVTEPETVTSPRSSGSGVSRVMVEEHTKLAESNDGAEVVEKPSSPPLPVPPPKPPRQKIDSAENSQSSRQGSSSSRLGSAGSGEKMKEGDESRPEESIQTELPVKSEVVAEDEEEKIKSEAESTEKSAGSDKSRSAKSKAPTDETAEADGQNSLDDVEDHTPLEVKTEVAADDGDVVHSATPKTGKISKLFKTKKQEVENGTKASNTTNTKAKSKTCIVL